MKLLPALIWALALGAAVAQVPEKMPTPVEDDPNAPSAMRQTPPPAAAPTEGESPELPYSRALVAYKAGDYEKALSAISAVDAKTQDDNFVILKAEILTELKRFKDAEAVLMPRAGDGASPAVLTALGDVLLRARSYERAMKYYKAALGRKNDPDLTLKLVYCNIGGGNLPEAQRLASDLTPFDAKNPYDDHASYYFAHAALAQTAGNAETAEEDIQSARTNYGITVTNRYLKGYLQFFATPAKGAPAGPPPAAAPKP
jgi:tetratricopeptide (TPR) repeat protein